MEEEKFWELLSLQLSGEASKEDMEVLEALLQKNPSLGLQAGLMVQLWKSKSNIDSRASDDFYNRHLQRLSNRPDIYPLPVDNATAADGAYGEKTTPVLYRWRWPLTGIAAALLIALGVFFYSSHPPKNEAPAAQNTVSTRKGSKSDIQLPDGTKAWLNADSKLTYDENFRGAFREVYLEGEAYFDVVKDKTRPFIIHTKTIDIRVLGTAFNVRAYESEKNTETALFRGSVEVTLHNNPEKKIVLKPNEKLMVNNKSLQFNTSGDAKKTAGNNTAFNITVGKVHFQLKDSSALETLWIKNKLVFDAESLEEVAGKIERWYNVKVVINGDEGLKSTAYSAIFENETLAQVMEALKITGNFKYSINRDTVTIK